MHEHRTRLAFAITGFVACWCLLPPALGAETEPATNCVQLPARKDLHLYLLMGQSNMAGRGKIGLEDKTPHPRVLVFTLADTWAPAVEPITRDKLRMSGVGPGLAFGKAMADRQSHVTIGLVPCAVGGTPLKRWEQGGDLYSNALHRAQLAMRDGTLKGILWHQGEGDSGAWTNASTYGTRLAAMIKDIRADLGTPNLPVVVGQIGEFLYARAPQHSPYARVVNDALARLPDTVPMTACASSKGLKHKGDQLHFDSASQHEFGRRYADAMSKLLSRQ